jgi:hypothetical protein
MAIVVDTTADIVRGGQFDERRGRRLRIRTGRLNHTALMVQAQIEDRVNPGALWPGVSGEDLALWLFDAELTVERLATAGSRAAMADIPAATRAELADTVAMLSRAIRIPHSHGLLQTAERAQQLTRPKRPPKYAPRSSASQPKQRSTRISLRRSSNNSGRACCRPPGKPFRWPSPRRWPSSSVRRSRHRAGIGR